MTEQTIYVHGTSGYPVYVGTNIAERLREAFADASAAVVTDDRVCSLWADRVKPFLPANTRWFILPAGEGSKNPQELIRLWNGFLEAGLDRQSVIAALGGGTVGDLAGFAAATYQRGIRYVQIPTTLLAMTDSSVGGKTAADLPGAKNAVGVFYRPSCVITDPGFLSTLPDKDIRSGMGEVIKYAFICRNRLPELLASPAPDLAELIAECVRSKQHLVEADEFDRGARMALNFGHTVGHAAEQLSGYSLPHGLCVVYGCLCVLSACEAEGLCTRGLTEQFRILAQKYSGIPDPGYRISELLPLMRRDKKAKNGSITFVYPPKIGSSAALTLTPDETKAFLSRGILR